MRDLISRKALFNTLFVKDGRICPDTNIDNFLIEYSVRDIKKVIREMPTAFDLESVIEQLEENKEDMLNAIKEHSKSEFEMIKIKDLKELFEEYTQEQIDIIKSAANATNGKNGG